MKCRRFLLGYSQKLLCACAVQYAYSYNRLKISVTTKKLLVAFICFLCVSHGFVLSAPTYVHV